MKKLIFIVIMTLLTSCNKDSSSKDDSESDDLSDGLPVNQQRIFLTSSLFSGNLGGISGADVKCQNAALAAGLKRTYKAFISTSSTFAIDRFNLDGPLYEVDARGNSILVAQSLTDFNSGNVLADPAFKYDENGNDQNVLLSRAASFWIATGTGSVNFCSDWTTDSATANGDIGCTNSGETIGWMQPHPCDQLISLLCISDS